MINRLKSPLVRIIGSFGGYYVARYLTRHKPRILMYHRFSGTKKDGYLDTELFEKQIKEIVNSFNVVSLSEIENYLTSDNKSKKNMISITIDDGYQDFYTYAYPVLKKYNLTATLFVTSGFIDQKVWLWPDKITYMIERSDCDEVSLTIGGVEKTYDMHSEKKYGRLWNELVQYCLNCSDKEKGIFLDSLNDTFKVSVPEKIVDDYLPCTWGQLQEMKENNIEIGGHTQTHPSLSKVELPLLESEILGCKQRLEEMTGGTVEHFCYPNGQLTDYNENVIAEVKKAGYKSATTAFSDNDPYKNCFELRRHAVGDNMFQFKKVIYGVELLGRQLNIS